MGGAGGVGAELGEDPPVLEVGEAVLDRCTSDGEEAVGILLARGELVSAAGCEAGDDHGVTYALSRPRKPRPARAPRPAARAGGTVGARRTPGGGCCFHC